MNKTCITLADSNTRNALAHPNFLMTYPRGSPAKKAPTTFQKIQLVNSYNFCTYIVT